MTSAVISAFGSLKSQFSIKEVNSDNTVFKLLSKVSFGFCIFASILVGLSEYIGKPIQCTQSTSGIIREDHFDAHCWIHGSKHIPEHAQEHFDCISKQSDDDDTDTNYYQWVVFMLAINALLFKIPSLIWKVFEGGLLKELYYSGEGVKSNLLTENAMSTNLTTHLWYLKKLKGKQMSYYTAFMVCQLLNVAMLFANWWGTDKFLSGNFHTYGSDVISYYQMDADYQRNAMDPMCNAFPTKVSCSMNYKGTGKGDGTLTGLCLLSQNIINEKIYLFLWFWFALMGFLGLAQLVFEVAILAIPNLRGTLISRQIGTFLTSDMKNYVQRTCNIGDWFLLYQIGKNTNKYFFYNLITLLSESKKSNYERVNEDVEGLLQHGNQCLSENESIEMDEKK